ncbi:RNA polymerase subunit sigma [Paracoccus caeni]|uniref:RNA polymerase subunit sigma n=1 Tax=Paracoccus caeni TaxID=657651 RepID=A0A934S9U1_9RHOB|nr:RNA polymerase subunit sigma [Paracoccus caeni]
MAILKDRPEAEDALHDIYVTVWKDAQGATRDGLRPMTWLIALAREKAVARLRGRARPADGANRPWVTVPAPSVEGARPGSINAALTTLEEPEAEALRAAYLGGLTYRDLAQRDGIPMVAVRSLLRRSLLRLKELVPA